MAHILTVGDDPSIQLLVKRVLNLDGHQVTEARGNPQGLQAYRNLPLDLILIDCQTAQQSVLKAVEKLRHTNPNIKMIVFSTGDTESIRTAIQAGARYIMIKPFKIHEFSRIITRHLKIGPEPYRPGRKSQLKLRVTFTKQEMDRNPKTPSFIQISDRSLGISWN